MGSAADALLDAFERKGRLGDISSYHFTELVVPFLRRGQRRLAGAWKNKAPLSFATVDMNRDLQAQGIGEGSADIVFAVNTLHVAEDLPATLGAVHRTLAPGGLLVAGECIRPFEHQPVAPELVFNLLESFRHSDPENDWRPRGGFLTPEQWHHACTTSGFGPPQFVPNIIKIRHVYPDFVVAAVVARKAS